MAALFSFASLVCAGDAALLAVVGACRAITSAETRFVASGAGLLLFCGACCLVAARCAG